MKYIFLILLSSTIVLAKANHEDATKQMPLQSSDTLNILISAANHVYYYPSPLAEDASNFKVMFATQVDNVIHFAKYESKKKDHSLTILLKIQKVKALDDESKQAVELIKKQPGYKKSQLTKWEKKLIELTEKQ